MSNGNAGTKTVESWVPARLDRLPFSRWHWLVIAALGITWILDGLEVTGTLIGGPVEFFVDQGQFVDASSYRADVTALNLIEPGPNTVQVSGLSFTASFSVRMTSGVSGGQGRVAKSW